MNGISCALLCPTKCQIRFAMSENTTTVNACAELSLTDFDRYPDRLPVIISPRNEFDWNVMLRIRFIFSVKLYCAYFDNKKSICEAIDV